MGMGKDPALIGAWKRLLLFTLLFFHSLNGVIDFSLLLHIFAKNQMH
jgi:hypothetical protein